MSQREPLTTYRTNAGGTIHTETTNPALLKLLREDSNPAPSPHLHKSPAAPAKPSHPAPAPAHHSPQREVVESPLHSTHHPITGVRSPPTHRKENQQPLERPVPTPRQSLSRNNLQDNPKQNPTYRSEDSYSAQDLAGSPVSQDYGNTSETDSHSSELAGLAPTPSRKSFAGNLIDPVSQEERSLGDEADDEGGDTEDSGAGDGELDKGEATPVASPGGDFDGGGGADKRRQQPRVQQPPAPLGAVPAAAAIPAGSRPGLAPAAPAGSGPRVGVTLSPRLADPDPHRFVTPYASRRLKDNANPGRASVASLSVTDERGRPSLAVPTEEKWSANQAARLKARGSSANNTTQDQNSAPQRSPVGNRQAPPTQHTVTEDQEEDLDLADSSQLPATHGKDNPPAPAHDRDSDGDVTPTNQLRTARSDSPATIEEGNRGAGPQHVSLQKPPPPATTFQLSPTPVRLQSPPLQSDPSFHRRGSDPPHSTQRAHGSSNDPAAGAPSSNPSSTRGTPVSILKKQREPEAVLDRVYVESPSFTKEEEDEYRFVSSRLDNPEEEESEHHATFRALDTQAVNAMDGVGGGATVARKPFKQVRYQDDQDRFEDREEEYRYGEREEEPYREPPPPVPKQRQYVLRSKNGSAQSGSERTGSQQEPPSNLQEPLRRQQEPFGRQQQEPFGRQQEPFGRQQQEPFRRPQQESFGRQQEPARRQEEPPELLPEQPRARSLVLPTGPTYDPQDEEDLKRETSYQQDLKHRVTTIKRVAEETVIPRLPLGVRESDDLYARDSLDVPEDIEIDSERLTRGGHPIPRRDSLEVYEHHRLNQAMRNTQWGDPPAPPPGGAAGPQRAFHPQRQGYGNILRQGYSEPQQRFANQDYSTDQDQGYDPPSQGYNAPPLQGRGYDAPPPRQGQGYGGDRQGYRQGEPPKGYGDRQGYGEPPQRGYSDQRPTYGDGANLSGGGGGYSDAYYQDQDGDTQRDQYGYSSHQPGRGGGNPRPQGQGQYQGQGSYQGQGQYQGQEGPPYQGHYLEKRAPQNYAQAEPQEGYYLTEPRSYNQGSGGPIYSQDYDDDDGDNPVYYNATRSPPRTDEEVDPDRYQSEDITQRTARAIPIHGAQAVFVAPQEPPKPSYDYVSHNKFDYGRPKKRNYKKIHEDKKDEEEKLTTIFIQPKVKGKKGQKSRSTDTSPTRYPSIAENPESGETQGPEELWAQRSASLANAKTKGKKKPRSNTSSLANAARYHSESSIPNSSQGRPPLQPLPLASNMQLVPVLGGQLSPSHVAYRGIDLQPISQQLITEDGQRISVDVNLRLISPTLGSGPEEVGAYRAAVGLQRQTGLQYPVGNVRGEQVYGTLDENALPRGRYSADDLVNSKGRGAGGYVSDSNHDYGDTVYSTNPYKKIPPIPTSTEAPRSAPPQGEGGSYMLSYLKEKEKMKSSDGGRPWYKVYGLSDYKRMQNEVKLGTSTLGPDLDNDTFKERREKHMRQMEYAKAVKDKNAKDFQSKKPPSYPRSQQQEEDIMNKRKLAIEYARNVPKPTVRPKPNPYNNYELASKLSPIAKHSHGQHHSATDHPSVEVLDLEKLHERHEQDKRSAELIRQKAQGMVT